MADILAFKPPHPLRHDAFQTIRTDDNLLIDLYDVARIAIPLQGIVERPNAHDLCVAIAAYLTLRSGRRPTVHDIVATLQSKAALKTTLATWSTEALGDDLPALVLTSRLRELAALRSTEFVGMVLVCLQHLIRYGRAVYGHWPAMATFN